MSKNMRGLNAPPTALVITCVIHVYAWSWLIFLLFVNHLSLNCTWIPSFQGGKIFIFLKNGCFVIWIKWRTEKPPLHYFLNFNYLLKTCLNRILQGYYTVQGLLNWNVYLFDNETQLRVGKNYFHVQATNQSMSQTSKFTVYFSVKSPVWGTNKTVLVVLSA